MCQNAATDRAKEKARKTSDVSLSYHYVTKQIKLKEKNELSFHEGPNVINHYYEISGILEKYFIHGVIIFVGLATGLWSTGCHKFNQNLLAHVQV